MNSFILGFLAIAVNATLTVKSPAFKDKDFIPSKYTCDGLNINPPLTIGDIPKTTQSIALVVDDPDAPKGTFDHWIMWNIPPLAQIDEGSTPGTQGENGKKENKYTGPCPPSGTHHYHFKVYALDSMLDLPVGTDKKALERAMKGHIIAFGELTGMYKKQLHAEK